VLFRSEEGIPGGSLPPGRYVIFGEVPTLRGLRPDGRGRIEEAEIVVSYERDHPAMRLSAIENVVVGSHIGLEVTNEARIIAELSSGPGIVEVADGPVRAIVIGFGAAESSWPFDPGFVLFLASVVEYLGADGVDTAHDEISPGETLTTRLPSGATNVKVVTPDGDRFSVNPASDGRISYGPIPRAGLYEVQWEGPAGPRDPIIDGKPRRAIPVNLFDPDESSLRVRESLSLVTGVTSTSVAGAGGGGETRSLWHWALLGLLGMLMLEWYVYNRKVHL